MKRILLILTLLTLFSCSKEDDCEGSVAQIRENYEPILTRDDLTAAQREQITKEYTQKLENACE